MLTSLIRAVALAALLLSTPLTGAADGCDLADLRTGACTTGTTGDDDVTLTGTDTDSDGSGGSGGGTGSTGGEGSGVGGDCIYDPDPDAPCQLRDDYDSTDVTLIDIAHFRPTPGVQRMQPDGWVVVDLPANIYAIASRHVVAGELLGEPADVRFTPVAYQWNYGDGGARTHSTPGGTWAALGLREFDPTPTSHIYRRSGDYTIRLSVVFRAEYRFAGGPFVLIPGSLTVPANELHITAGTATTVLVNRDCARDPGGPGC